MHSKEPNVSPSSEYYVYTPSANAQKIFFYPICIGHFIYEPGYFLKRNRYDSFMIMLVLKGNCAVTYNNNTLIATEGYVVFLDCYESHQYDSCTGWEAYLLHFDGPLCRQYYEQITLLCGNIIVPENSPVIEKAISTILDSFKEGISISEALISRNIVEILTELLLTGAVINAPPNARLLLTNSISYINSHFAEPISLRELSEYASLSPFYYTRLFTRQTGLTPHQYILATRISCAKYLLKTTDLTIKEVGLYSGFTSESSFSTTFRQWEHITPSDYRALGSFCQRRDK